MGLDDDDTLSVIARVPRDELSDEVEATTEESAVSATQPEVVAEQPAVEPKSEDGEASEESE